MGIDRIGKGGAPSPAPPASGGANRTGPTTGANRVFEVPEASGPAAPSATGSSASAASATQAGPVEGDSLRALRSGAVDVDGYLDLKVDEATAHLGPMPAADRVRLRAALRERLATDPTLVDLVKSATGSVPRVPDDD
jgi:hypothetical protein